MCVWLTTPSNQPRQASQCTYTCMYLNSTDVLIHLYMYMYLHSFREYNNLVYSYTFLKSEYESALVRISCVYTCITSKKNNWKRAHVRTCIRKYGSTFYIVIAMVVLLYFGPWENWNFSFHFQFPLNLTSTNTKVGNMLKANDI